MFDPNLQKFKYYVGRMKRRESPKSAASLRKLLKEEGEEAARKAKESFRGMAIMDKYPI